jgi:hypothetical protein
MKMGLVILEIKSFMKTRKLRAYKRYFQVSKRDVEPLTLMKQSIADHNSKGIANYF